MIIENCNISVAMDTNGAIGKDNALLCHLPDDLKRFKALTMGHPVVMGRKTWDSLPKRPLPGRYNYVVTSSSNIEDAITLHSPEEVENIKEEFFVIGGVSMYRLFLPLAGRLYLTRIHHTFSDADAFFPPVNPALWYCESREFHPADERHPYPFTFEVLRRNT